MTQRRAYNKSADTALQQASLGPRRRFNGMAKLLARAGRGLSYQLPQMTTTTSGDTEESGSESDDDEKEPDRPFEPLRVWKSPHPTTPTTTKAVNTESNNNPLADNDHTNNNADETNDLDDNNTDNSDDDDDEPLERKGLPARRTTITQSDEYGIDEQVTVLQPAPVSAYAKTHVFVPPVLAKWLRPQYVLFSIMILFEIGSISETSMSIANVTFFSLFFSFPNFLAFALLLVSPVS